MGVARAVRFRFWGAVVVCKGAFIVELAPDMENPDEQPVGAAE